MMKKYILASILALAISSPVLADEAPQSDVMVYGGYSHPTEGFSDRAYAGFFYNQYLENGLGVHLDGTYVDREEDGALGVIGMSAPLGVGVRAKVAVGASTDVNSILPKFVVRAELPVKLGSTVITPEYSYREYRTDITDHNIALNVARYFNIVADAGGYYVAQGRVAHSIVNEFKNTTSGSIGLTAVRKNGIQVGISGEYGELAYSTIVEGVGIIAPGVESDFFAIRPSLSVPLSQRVDFVARGEFSHNDFYESTGVMLGIKLKLN
jgi:YaiO family outer membrane protein